MRWLRRPALRRTHADVPPVRTCGATHPTLAHGRLAETRCCFPLLRVGQIPRPPNVLRITCALRASSVSHLRRVRLMRLLAVAPVVVSRLR